MSRYKTDAELLEDARDALGGDLEYDGFKLRRLAVYALLDIALSLRELRREVSR